MKRRQWSEDERFMFATQRLRASRIPDKKKQMNKQACRRKSW